MYVYADVVFFINFIMNLVIFICTGWASGVRIKYGRLSIAACMGSFYALGELLPNLAILYYPISKICFSIILVCIAYGFTSIKKTALLLSLFYCISFFFGGAIIGWLLFGGETQLSKPINWEILLGGSLLASLLILMAVRWISKYISRKELFFQVTIEFSGHTIHLKGLLDTGNQLYSLVGHKPVIIINYSALKNILSAEVVNYLDITQPDMWVHHLSKCQDKTWLSRTELVPYRGIGNQNILLGFRPDRVTVEVDQHSIYVDAIIAIRAGQFSCVDDYEVLLHPKVLENKKNGEANVCA